MNVQVNKLPKPKFGHIKNGQVFHVSSTYHNDPDVVIMKIALNETESILIDVAKGEKWELTKESRFASTINQGGIKGFLNVLVESGRYEIKMAFANLTVEV